MTTEKVERVKKAENKSLTQDDGDVKDTKNQQNKTNSKKPRSEEQQATKDVQCLALANPEATETPQPCTVLAVRHSTPQKKSKRKNGERVGNVDSTTASSNTDKDSKRQKQEPQETKEVEKRIHNGDSSGVSPEKKRLKFESDAEDEAGSPWGSYIMFHTYMALRTLSGCLLGMR